MQKPDALLPRHPGLLPAKRTLTTVTLPDQSTSALAALPLSQVARTYLISAVSSSPILLSACVRVLETMLKSRTWLTSVERNPVLTMLLRETFYKQFCAGSNKQEVRACVANMQRTGVNGVVLEYAREVLDDGVAASDPQADVDAWSTGILSSIDIAKPGDCVAFKWSGMGLAALQLLKAKKQPSPAMTEAMQQVCKMAAAKDILLLPAAEETNTLDAFHDWSIGLQRQFNRGDKAIMYTTYQAYLKCTAGYVAEHLADAKKHGYVLGAKIVRGAYLGTEERHKIWETKDATDACYDGISAALLQGVYNEHLRPTADAADAGCMFPKVDFFMATHNIDSVRKAQAIRDSQTKDGKPKIALAYAQLQGMADEVSCELVHAAKRSATTDAPKVYKYMPWGSMTECLTYLLRRASENKEAAGRTRDSKLAMGVELRRRILGGA